MGPWMSSFMQYALPALIGGGASLGVASIGAGATSKQSRKNRNEQRRQYEKNFQYMDEMDMNKPWHKLSAEVQDQYTGLQQQGLDMQRESNNQQLIDQYQLASSAGATLQEFLGSPAPGNSVSGQSGATLGNMASQQNAQAAQSQMQLQSQQMQLQHDAQQRDADRQVQIMGLAAETGKSVADITSGITKGISERELTGDIATLEAEVKAYTTHVLAEAGIESSEIAAAATKAAASISAAPEWAKVEEIARVNDANIDKIRADTALILQGTIHEQELHDERHYRQVQQMGPENVAVGLSLKLNGVDPVEFYTSQGLDEETAQRWADALDAVTAQGSKIYKESKGGEEAPLWAQILGGLAVGAGAIAFTGKAKGAGTAINKGYQGAKSWWRRRQTNKQRMKDAKEGYGYFSSH